MYCDGELIFQFPVFSFVQACRSFHFYLLFLFFRVRSGFCVIGECEWNFAYVGSIAT